MIGKVIRTDVGDMVTATSLPALPDPKSIKDEASARVEKAIAFAKSSPVPAPETALQYVFT